MCVIEDLFKVASNGKPNIW